MTKIVTLSELSDLRRVHRGDKWYVLRWRIKRFRSFIRRLPRRMIKWPYQRLTRGYRDCDMFNGDMYLAGLYANMLEWYIKNGMGVSTMYSEGNDDDVDAMALRRDAEYAKYAAVFRKYSKEGICDTVEHIEIYGGVLDSDMTEALEWMSKVFTSLWD